MANHNSNVHVQRSFGRCKQSPGFLDDFHRAYLQTKDLCQQGFGRQDSSNQKQLLKQDLSIMMHVAPARDRRTYSDGFPGPRWEPPCWLQDNWKPALFHTIKKHDAMITWELLEEWDEVIQSRIDELVSKCRVRELPYLRRSRQARTQQLAY